jgi:pimeloyl-ACP methyl ester carboxylesterase
MEIPEVQYTKSGDVNIAYQVTGGGPFDLVFVPGYVTHLEIHWTMPAFAPFLEKLSSFCRLIRFDKRGTGMSDRISGARTARSAASRCTSEPGSRRLRRRDGIEIEAVFDR